MNRPDGIRKRLSFVFCDIAGYGRLVEREGDLVGLEVIRTFVEKAGRLAAEHHCLLIKFVGDGFLAAFENLADPLPFVRAVEALRSEDAALAGRQLAFTFSLHVGDAIYVETSYGNEVLGADVNVAARLERLAKPGQMVVSHAALEQLPEAQRGLAGPVETATVKSAGAVAYSRIELAGP